LATGEVNDGDWQTKSKSPAMAPADPSTNLQPPENANGESKEGLVVFAFRLTAAERELLHKAAGPAKASRFVRTLAVAAARGERERVEEILGFEGETIN
jgi:hypothetical protein